MPKKEKPVILVTGAAGKIGTALVQRLKADYTVVGIDMKGKKAACDCIAVDLTNADSIALALRKFREKYGGRIASVIHLAAYFDFTGDPHPLYRKLNVDGTRLLLEALQDFDVEQFTFSGTMLVHKACQPGERIDEETPIAPKWAYPESKAAAEDAIREAHGDIPIVLLHLAGLYDDKSAVPTLSHQIARIYERALKSRFYSGDTRIGQSVIHQDDLVDLVERVVARRTELPKTTTILAGEPDAVGYGALQDRIGCLIHGEKEWRTLSIPQPVAKSASWIETKSEPIVPDDIDQGEKPFIRPFMVEMANDHYALDISRAEELLDWRPKHDLRTKLKKIIVALKEDPLAWYDSNGITPPDWLEVADKRVQNVEGLRERWESQYRKQHQAYLWTHFVNMILGLWLILTPTSLEVQSEWLVVSDVASGSAVLLLSMLTLSWRFGVVRWLTAAVGLWVLFAPLVFWVPTAAVYLNETLVGALIIGFAIATPPVPAIDPAAALTGPTKPKGWDFSPSAWTQRLPIIILALAGLFISRHLAAYQLGHTDGIWEPFFSGTPDSGTLNGTEEIVTSNISDAWPVSDAGLGAFVYILEILTGIVGSTRRWRTMPWLVLFFGVLIVPLGAVSITFIIIQPILIGTWCTLCLIAAAAMLIQIPYSLDELAATGEFLWRRHKEGRPVLRILFRGDTDDGPTRLDEEDFERPYGEILRDIWSRSITVPWNMALCLLIGIWLMFTRITLGTTDGMADADHLIGSLIVTITVIAFSEVARVIRFINIPLGIALLITPFAYGADWPATTASLIAGAALIALSFRRGVVLNKYGELQRFIV